MEMLMEDICKHVQDCSSFIVSRNESLKKEATRVNWCVPLLFADWLILQASHPVFEGDKVLLRCLGKEEGIPSEKIYYKDGKKLGSTYSTEAIILNSVSLENSKYHCTVSRKDFWSSWKETSKPLRIQVQGNGYTSVGNRAQEGNSACGLREGTHQ